MWKLRKSQFEGKQYQVSAQNYWFLIKKSVPDLETEDNLGLIFIILVNKALHCYTDSKSGLILVKESFWEMQKLKKWPTPKSSLNRKIPRIIMFALHVSTLE